MATRFAYYKSSLMIFALFVSVSLRAMGDEGEVYDFYFDKKPTLVLTEDVTIKETAYGLFDKVKDAVSALTAPKTNAEMPQEQPDVVAAPEAPQGETQENSQAAVQNTNDAKVFKFGTHEIALLAGGTALVLVIGGVTYVLYKNGKLAHFGKALAGHPLLSAATASMILGVVAAAVFAVK